MTTNNDNYNMGKTVEETAPKTKKKSVRWGENIEYQAPPVGDFLAAGELRPSSTATASAMNEMHPRANINGPNHHPHPQHQQYNQQYLTTAEIDGYSNYHRQRNQHQQVAQSQMLNNSMREEENTSEMSVCRIPGHTHIWKNCPDNPRSKRYKGGKKNPPRAPTPPPGFAAHGTASLEQVDLVRPLPQPAAATAARAAPTSNAAFGEQQTHHRHQHEQLRQQQDKVKKQPPPPRTWQRGPHAPCSLPGHDHKWMDCPNNPLSIQFCGVSNRDVLFGSENKRPPPPSHQQQQRHQPDFRGGSNVGGTSANNGTYAAFGDADVPDWRSLQQQDYPHQQHPSQQQNRQQQQRQWGNKSMCRIPGHSGHTWINCPNNPNSPKFDGNFGSHLMLLPLGSAAVDNPSVATPTAAAASKEPLTHGAKSTMPSASSSSSSVIARPTATSRTFTAPGTSGSADATESSIPRKGIAIADLSRPIPRRTSSQPPPDTTATVPGGGGITADPHRTLKTTDLARPMHQRTALVRPNTVAGGGGVNTNADHLFNKTDSARPVPRKVTMANQQHPHQHIQSQQDPQSQQGQKHIEKTVTTGIRGRRKIQRAPVGTDAMPLQKHTSSRLLKVQKGKDSGGNSPHPHPAEEEGAEGSPDGLSNLPEDRRGGGREDDNLTSPALLQGTSNWWVEDSPPSEAAPKKRKAPNTKKGKDKKKRKNKERRGEEGDRRGSAEDATVTTTGTSTSSPFTTSMASTETSDLKGLKVTGVKNKVDIANAAIAALGCVDNGGASDNITYGDNDSGENMSMSDDDDLPMISLGSFNGQGKKLFKKTLKFSKAAAAATAAASSLSSTPTASKPTTDVSEDSDMATYKAALAALGYDGGAGTAYIGAWDKTSSGDYDYGEDISISDDDDRPLISLISSKGLGKKHRKATNSKPKSIDSVHVSKVDMIGETLDDNEMLVEFEKDLFDDVEQKLVLAEKREHEGVINEAAEAARLQRPLRTGGESGEVANATRQKMKSKDKSSSSAKKRRESSSRPTQQSAESVERPASWTDEEIRLYELGLKNCKNNWGRIASEYVKSRTAHQVREYARRCIGLVSPSKQQGGTVNEARPPPQNDKHREQQQSQLGKSTIPMPVSTDISLSLPAKNTPKDEWILIEKLQGAVNEGNGGGIVAIRGGNSTPLPASPGHNGHTSKVAESSYGAANVAEDADEDDDISAFITCNKCCLVFDNMAKANKHEKTCTFMAKDGIDSMPLHGRVFRDKNTLLQYMHRRYLWIEPSVDGERIYYCP
ncbi:hypothetical protein ACHAXH_003629 [Discostella pseudostelligera]